MTIKSTRKNNNYTSKTLKHRSTKIYTDDNPHDTIPIKYTSLQDVKNTIINLEHLYKINKYSHKRISQVALILKVRLNIIKHLKPKHFILANKYLKFINSRTKLPDNQRHSLVFNF
jgi:hypothetical protein